MDALLLSAGEGGRLFTRPPIAEAAIHVMHSRFARFCVFSVPLWMSAWLAQR